MALYQMYFAAIASNAKVAADGTPNWRGPHIVNQWAAVRKMLEESVHTMLFIITKYQWEIWEQVKETYKLHEFMEFEMPYYVSNYVYGGSKEDPGRKMRVVILKGKGNQV